MQCSVPARPQLAQARAPPAPRMRGIQSKTKCRWIRSKPQEADHARQSGKFLERQRLKATGCTGHEPASNAWFLRYPDSPQSHLHKASRGGAATASALLPQGSFRSLVRRCSLGKQEVPPTAAESQRWISTQSLVWRYGHRPGNNMALADFPRPKLWDDGKKEHALLIYTKFITEANYSPVWDSVPYSWRIYIEVCSDPLKN